MVVLIVDIVLAKVLPIPTTTATTIIIAIGLRLTSSRRDTPMVMQWACRGRRLSRLHCSERSRQQKVDVKQVI